MVLVVWYVQVYKVRKGRTRRTNITCNDLTYRPLEIVRKYRPCGQTDIQTDNFVITKAETQLHTKWEQRYLPQYLVAAAAAGARGAVVAAVRRSVTPPRGGTKRLRIGHETVTDRSRNGYGSVTKRRRNRPLNAYETASKQLSDTRSNFETALWYTKQLRNSSDTRISLETALEALDTRNRY